MKIKRHRYVISLCEILLVMTMCSGALADEWRHQASLRLRQWLEPHVLTDFSSCNNQRLDLRAALVRFYEHRNYQLAWVDHYGLLPEGELALSVIQEAAFQGLDRSDYHSPWLDDLLSDLVTRPVVNGAEANTRYIQLDLVVTEMVLRYAYHLTLGRTDPRMLTYGDKSVDGSSRDLAAELAEVLSTDRLDQYVKALGPRHPDYRRLMVGLQRYRKIQDAGGWPVIDAGPTLKRGDRDLRVALLRCRLAVTGDIPPVSGVIDDIFDDTLEAGVRRFQIRHGLAPDGVVGDKTLAILNVPVEQRIRQIELNLERWRWMPADLGSPHILVNIPGFELKIVASGQVLKTLRAIVGRQRRPTPMLASAVTYLEINPYWHVPPKIAREDLLPKIQGDPSFLVRQDFRVFAGWDEAARELNPHTINWASYSEDYFPFQLRQEPTADNALGRVKFMFPNDLSVYIHDTPSKSLFAKPFRDFSSGCVRVEKPLELAAFFLARQNWDQQRLDQAVASRQRQVVVLKAPVPVYLVYFTAWVDENGEVYFREDLYGHDQQLLNVLADATVERQNCSDTILYPTYMVQTDQASNPNQPITSAKAPL